MSVRFDFTKCTTIPRDESVTIEGETGIFTHPVTDEWWKIIDRAIWRCLVIGIGTITEANRAEWFARSMLYCDLTDDEPITPQQVITLTGLSVNASPETMAHFRKRLMDNRTQFLTRQFTKALEEQTTEAAA